MSDDQQPYLPVQTSIERDDARSIRQHAPYRVGFKKTFDEKLASTNIEWLTQGELLTLWQQIGVLFNLSDMADGLSAEAKAEFLRTGIMPK